MNPLRMVLVALALLAVAGCHATKPGRPQAHATPSRRVGVARAGPLQAGEARLALILGLMNSLTVAQVRKANAEGVLFSELTPQQQAAVSRLWAEYAALCQTEVAAGTATPVGPVERVRITSVEYTERPLGGSGTRTLVELREGDACYGVSVHSDTVPPAIKEAGADLVAGGRRLPRTGTRGNAGPPGKLLPPRADN